MKSHGSKLIHYPDTGRLSFDYQTVTLPAEPDQMLVAYTATNQTTRDALTALAA